MHDLFSKSSFCIHGSCSRFVLEVRIFAVKDLYIGFWYSRYVMYVCTYNMYFLIRTSQFFYFMYWTNSILVYHARLTLDFSNSNCQKCCFVTTNFCKQESPKRLAKSTPKDIGSKNVHIGTSSLLVQIQMIHRLCAREM